MNPVSTTAADSRQLTDIPVRTAAACRQQNGQNTTHKHKAQHNTLSFSLRRSRNNESIVLGFLKQHARAPALLLESSAQRSSMNSSIIYVAAQRGVHSE